jgi:hypothetical protein
MEIGARAAAEATSVADRDYQRTRMKPRRRTLGKAAQPHAIVVGRKRRVLVFERDGWICRGCGRELVDVRHLDSEERKRANGRGLVPTLDHIVPVSRGGNSTMGNLQTMCRPCNQLKGALMPHLSARDAENIRLRAENQRLAQRLRELELGESAAREAQP